MAKNPNQKLKILYIAKLFYEMSDEQHPVEMSKIISYLSEKGIQAERKSIYDDIEALRTIGMDIELSRGKIPGYFIGNRLFELPELKLLVDTVQSSKFITQKKSLTLIKKIESLTSRDNAIGLQRQVFVINRIKTMNESIYYNVDSINDALMNNVKINFRYFEWNAEKQKQFHRGGNIYTVSPISLCWDDENYYLIAFDDAVKEIRHYRVDRMLEIEKSTQTRDEKARSENFDTAIYSKKLFGMYNGKEEQITFLCDNSVAGVIVDRFGKDVLFMKSGTDKFKFSAKIAVSPLFLSWVISFGKKIQVISPDSVIKDLRKLINENAEIYGNNED